MIKLPPLALEQAETAAGAVAAGKAKAGMSPTQIFGRGILSGCHIGFGAYLMLTVGAACPGSSWRRTLRAAP